MSVIGLSGLKGCGKDTAAQPLIEDGWTRLALADPVREMLYTLNPIVKTGPPTDRAFAPRDDRAYTRWSEYLDEVGYDQAKKNPEVRRLMQVFATEVIREQIGQNVWLDLAANKIRQVPGNYVLTDVRFDNEAKMIHSLGGFMLRIDRAGLTSDGHASEAGISEELIDVVVKNNADVQALHLQMRGAARTLGSLRRVG